MAAYVIDVAMTPFRRYPEKSHKELSRDVLGEIDAERLQRVESIWFGSCAMHTFGQANIGGQVCLADSPLPENTPIQNIESACATGGQAFMAAVRDVNSGDADFSLAMGVEKTFHQADPATTIELFDGALDQMDPKAWQEFYQKAAAEIGEAYEPSPHRIQILDICALQARWHMKTFGTTKEQLALVAAKNHEHSVDNEYAQYRKAFSKEHILGDVEILSPFTRSMCSPVSDGAAAVMVCSEAALQTLAPETKEGAIKVEGIGAASGCYRSLAEPSVAFHAARRAYRQAAITPEQVDLVELHDATSFAEIYLSEMLGFCEKGQGGAYAESGETRRGGKRPINLSGGLVSKGHPLAATGLAMIHDLACSLREGTGSVALFENGGGLVGFDEAASVVGILSRAN